MKAELPTKDILDFANEKLLEKSLQPVTRRTLDYWIAIGLMGHPKRKGKAGRGLFPDSAKLRVVCIRELQERFNFTLADIRALVANDSRLEDVLNLMTEVEETYGRPLVPYARPYACSNRVGGTEVRDEAADFYIAYRVAEGDEELGIDEVTALVGIDSQSVLDMARSHELPCHGNLRLRFLNSEIGEWRTKSSSPGPTVFTDVMKQLIDLTNELRRIDSLDSVPEKSREWLTYWIDAVDGELWRLRRLCHEAGMREKDISSELKT